MIETLPDIPRERVAELVMALFDIENLDGVCDVHISREACYATVYARDEKGSYYFGEDGDVAKHKISRRVR